MVSLSTRDRSLTFETFASPAHKSLLIAGPENSGKSSLSFAIAVSEAKEGARVIYICNRNKIESKFPLLYDPVNLNIYSKIIMRYVSSTYEIKAYLASIHASMQLPAIIIIEDLSLIIDPLRSVSRRDQGFLECVLFIISLIMDTIQYIEKNTLSSVKLIITDICMDPSYLTILQRIIETAVVLKPYFDYIDCSRTHSIYDLNNLLPCGKIHFIDDEKFTFSFVNL